MIQWITDNSAFVTTISGLLTLLVTIIYVSFTYRLIHIPYRSFIKPTALKSGPKFLTNLLYVKNLGIYASLDVKVKYIGIEDIDGINGNFTYNSVQISEEIVDLESSSEGHMYMNFLIKDTTYFQLSWRSVTGKKYKSYYLYRIGFDDILRKLNFFEMSAFKLRLTLTFFASLYLKSRVLIFYKNRKFRVEVLKCIKSNQPMHIDDIKDKLYKHRWIDLDDYISKQCIKGYLKESSPRVFVVSEKGNKKYRTSIG